MNLPFHTHLDRTSSVANRSPASKGPDQSLRPVHAPRHRRPTGPAPRRARWLAGSAAAALALLPAASVSANGGQLARTVSQMALVRSALIAQAPHADVSVTITGPDTVAVNHQLGYRIAITNLGPDLAANVTMTDHLPSVLAYVSANTTQGHSNISAGIVRTEVGALLVGQTVIINLVVIPRATGPLVNGVAIQHDTQDPNPSNNSDGHLVTVTPFPAPPPTPETPPPPCAADVSASVAIARGPLFYAPITRRFLQQLIMENKGKQPIRGPITVLVEGLAPIVLTNASGFTGCWPPLDTPYLNASVGADGILKPGEVTTVTLVMAIPPNRGITYKTRVVGGPGSR
jgi:uncharacterized repeat protein (TIGR01451 family)